jgi:hypothetical protein
MENWSGHNLAGLGWWLNERLVDVEVKAVITINVPVIFMARYVMIFSRAIFITRAIIRGGP